MEPSKGHLDRAREFVQDDYWRLLDKEEAVDALARLICDTEARGYTMGAQDQRARPNQHVEQTVLVAAARAEGRF